MNVEELRIKKLKLETELRDFISKKIDDFTKDTGIGITSCSIDLLRFSNGSGEHSHYVTSVNTWIKL